MFGTVTRYYEDKGYGFIRGEDGNTYFIHATNLYGERIARGYYVHFKTFVTDRSDYNVHFTELSGRHSVLERPLSEVNGRLFFS